MKMTIDVDQFREAVRAALQYEVMTSKFIPGEECSHCGCDFGIVIGCTMRLDATSVVFVNGARLYIRKRDRHGDVLVHHRREIRCMYTGLERMNWKVGGNDFVQ